MENPQRQVYKKLLLVLGDQLDRHHQWFAQPDPDALIIIAELAQETGYVTHHVQKICAFFAAMETFAAELARAGHAVVHFTLDDTARFVDLPAFLEHLCKQFSASELHYQNPDEYRLQQQLSQLRISNVVISAHETEHFLLPHSELANYITPGRHNRMETFYRKMRVRFNILMDGDKPLGAKWNFDQDNRNKLKLADIQTIPEPLLFTNDVTAILDRLEQHGVKTIGTSMNSLVWPVSRTQSLALLEYFCQHCLPRFGRFQDAMTRSSEYQWSLFHSRLSFALNSKMLNPREVIATATAAYQESEGSISLAQIEGFIRQILGWREYIRAVYWVNMPAYARLNALDSQRKLPDYFWNGNTRMSCMQHAINQSLEFAYAHHIQRLMVTGNFCLIAGISPDQVEAWYLGIYIDAIEWVEMPNTRGMSQFTDGGQVATKPYCASANYINKMSDYCTDCHYDFKARTGTQACPFNSLYWHFMVKHRKQLAANPRINMIYRSWDSQSAAGRADTLARAQWCLEHLEEL